MGKLNDLIKELCPNGVEYKKLGDISQVCKVKNKFGYDNVGTVSNKSAVLVSTTEYFGNDVSSSDKSGYTVVEKGWFVYNPSRINVGSIAYSNSDTPVVVSPMYVVFRLDENVVDRKFFMYWLKSSACKAKIQNSVEIGARFRLPFEKLAKFIMPCPPMDVQRAIVSYLDKFIDMQNALQAELELQLKRLEEVRNDVLCRSYMMRADKNSHLVRLGDIGKFERCTGLQKNDLVDNPGDGFSPCLHYGQIYTYYRQVADVSKSYCDNALAEKMVKAHKGDLVIATTSENLEDVGTPVVWNGNSDWSIGGETYVYRHNQNPVFLANQFMTYDFFKYKQKRQTGTKVVRLNDKALSEYQIWLPSIDVQNKIAKFLHAYDLLVNDISNGLPAEIKLRQQQYEYYRDELLSFKLTNV